MSRKPALSFIFLTLVLDILGIGIVVPILPTLVKELQGKGLESASYTFGMMVSVYALMQFLFAPMFGSLSDRFGRRPVILTALFGAGLDYFFLALAPTLTLFFIGRVIAGITGANFAAATAYIADVSPPEKRAANFGLVGAAFGLGFIIGPALGGVLGQSDPRLPFFVAGGLTLVNWLYGMFVLPESLAPENRRAFSWKRSNPVGALLDLRRYPMVMGLSWAYFLASVAHQVFPSTWVLYTGHRYGWTPKEVGWSLSLVGVMAALVQGGLIRKVMPMIGEKKATVIGLSVTAVSFVLYGFASQGWMALLIIIVGSIGGLATPAIQGLVSRSVGADEQGGVQGTLTSLNSVAGVIGPAIATGLFGYFISKAAPMQLPGAPYFASAAVVVVALGVAVRAFRRGTANGR